MVRLRAVSDYPPPLFFYVDLSCPGPSKMLHRSALEPRQALVRARPRAQAINSIIIIIILPVLLV